MRVQIANGLALIGAALVASACLVIPSPSGGTSGAGSGSGGVLRNLHPDRQDRRLLGWLVFKTARVDGAARPGRPHTTISLPRIRILYDS